MEKLNNLKVFVSKRTKGYKPMLEGDDPEFQ
jgi:hypothetical protein